jgi:HEAT repeat protein/S1-C subfamily serine protease
VAVLLVLGGGLLLFCCAGGGIGGYLLWPRQTAVTSEPSAAELQAGFDRLGPNFPELPVNLPKQTDPPAVKPAEPGPDRPFAPPAPGGLSAEDVYRHLLKSTAFLMCAIEKPKVRGTAFGSGSIVHKDERLILTNYHVIDDAKTITVFFPELTADGSPITSPAHYFKASARLGIKGTVVARSPGRDLALVQLTRLPADARPVGLAPKSCAPGQNVYSIGASGVRFGPGIEGGALWRYTTGQVRLLYPFRARLDNAQIVDTRVVETNSPTNPGDSGGPMVNDRVQLVAVVSAFSGKDRLVSLNIEVAEARRLLEEHFTSMGRKWVDPDPGIYLPSSPEDEKLPPSHWVQLLREGDPAWSEKARGYLVRQGALAVPDLCKALKEANPRLRLKVLSVLGQIGDLASEAVGDVAASLTEGDAAVRTAAAEALGSIGKPARAALPELVRTLADPHPGVRSAARESLAKLGPPTKADVPRLAALFREKDSDRRLAIVNSLRALKLDAGTSMALFGPLLKDPNRKIRVECIRILADQGKPARAAVYPQLLAMLEDADAEVRLAALAALPSLGPPEEGERIQLQEALRGTQPELRRYAAEALGMLGPKAAPSVPMLARALGDSEASVRSAAVAALVKTGKPAESLLDEVLALRGDSDPGVRKNVAEFLGMVGRKTDVANILLGMMGDGDEAVRAAVFKALHGLQPPPDKDDVQRYSAALKNPKADVRRFAAAELARIGPDSAAALPTLLELMKDPDSEVQQNAYAAIGAIGPKANLAVPQLLGEFSSALADADNDPAALTRFRRASITLGKIGAIGSTLPRLRQALKGKNEALRKEVLTIIASLGPDAKEAIPDLCALLSEPGLRDTVAATLAKMGRSAVPELKKVIEHGPRDAKLGALRSLGKMTPEEAKDAVTDVYQAAKIYRGSEVGELALEVLGKINPPKKKE